MELTNTFEAMSNYNTSFAQTLQSLNAEQREAVDTIDGPVLVVAGPGTGKTHILSARIGQILTQTDTAPYNILCLTFTDAGVQAMRERLLDIIGPTAHKIHIFTFHSFCNKVIQDNLDLFARQDLALLDDLERQEIIRTLIDDLTYDHPLKKGLSDVHFYEKHLADLFKLMKTEAWTIDFVEKNIDTYLADIPQRKEFIYQNTKKGLYQKGDSKQDKLDETRLKMERLRSAVKLYPKFEAKLKEKHRYDFDDMVLWVIDAFERLPFLLRHYQEQYLYFLVDEYQDSNGSQNKILSQLIGYWENPNIFIVGDDDQAIYEFQGARLKSLLEFYDKYQEQLKIILLKENYRSTQAILNHSKQLIDANNLRIINQLQGLNIDKNLVAKGKIALSKVEPTIVEYPNRFHETVGIVAEIERLKQGNYPLSKIAVIYAKHREIENYITLFEKRNIPYQTKRRINILDTPLMQNIRLLLTYVSAEAETPFAGESLLFKVLNINFLDIAAKDILLLTKYISDKIQTPIDEDLAFESLEKESVTWRNTLSNLPKLWFKNLAQLKKISTFLNESIQNTFNMPLLDWVEKTLNQSGLLTWANKQPNKILPLQIIHTFFEFIKSETERKPRLSLSELLDILNILDKNHLSIELVQNIQNTEGVVLTTAHSAKGLEFDKVFLIDTVESEWENAKSGNRNRFTLPDTLTFTTEEDATEARRRLFYVAMTRAKEYLQISYAKADDKGKPLTQSQFVDELSAKRQASSIEENTLLEYQFAQLGESPEINTELIETEHINAVLKDFKLSVSALNVYLNCPLSFYFEYILKIPTTMSEAARYGSSMHYALRKLFGEMLRSKEKAFLPKSDFIQFFETDMQSQRWRFLPSAYSRRLAIGRDNLGSYYEQNIANWSKNVVVERSITAECEGVPIKGVIDKVEFKEDGTVHIVDYKTGKMLNENTQKPTAKKPLGGQYWRQLVFYKLLYENYRSNLVRVKSGEISYLEPDNKGVFKSKIIEIEPQDVEILRGVITDTWGKIQQHQFKGCGKKECNWCNFIRNNATPHSFRMSIIEDLDE